MTTSLVVLIADPVPARRGNNKQSQASVQADRLVLEVLTELDFWSLLPLDSAAKPSTINLPQ